MPQLAFLQVLFAGEAPERESESEAAHHLLALGFIKEADPFAQDSHTWNVYVIAAPLLATVMLKFMTIETSHTVRPPPAGAESDVRYAFNLRIMGTTATVQWQSIMTLLICV